MSYIGQGLPADVFSGFTTDTFAGDGSATTFTLSKAPFSEDGLIVVINNVIQKPTTNFTVSGTTLTIVGTAVASGDVIYAIHTSGAVPSTLASKVDVNGLSDGVILDADGDTTISADTDDQIDFKVGGTDFMSLTATGATITTADNNAQLTLTSTDADGNAGPVLKLTRDSGSPADDDFLGNIQIEMDNDAGENLDAVSILAQAKDVSDASEDARLYTYVRTAGSMRDRFSIAPSETVFNEDQVDVDFRVESDADANCFKIDAGKTLGGITGVGAIGIGDDPTIYFHIKKNLLNDVVFRADNSHDTYPYVAQLYTSGATKDNNTQYFLACVDATTTRFRIWSDGDVVNHDNSYAGDSDSRIKQGIRDANSQWDDIKALKIRNYKRNDDVELYGDKAWEQIGVIAQELEDSGMDKLVKNEVLWDKDDPEVKSGEQKEGDVKTYKAVKYSILYMKAVKALQEAMAKIETLETKVKALEDA
jgi:hypothetical protein